MEPASNVWGLKSWLVLSGSRLPEPGHAATERINRSRRAGEACGVASYGRARGAAEAARALPVPEATQVMVRQTRVRLCDGAHNANTRSHRRPATSSGRRC